MTDNFHTPIPEGAAANANTFNNPLGEMDAAITELALLERDGHIIQNEGTDLAQQPRIDFVGSGVIATNEPGKTKVTISGGVESIVAGDNIDVDDTDPANPVVSLLGGAGLTVSDASVTTSNVTGVEDTLHNLDISGMTASRDFNLPTPSAASKRVGVRIDVGDDAYELVVKINGVEWSRLAITGEIVTFVSTGTGAADWAVEIDGRIAFATRITNTAAQAISNNTATTVTLDEEDTNFSVGDCANTVSSRIDVRRTGKYRICAFARYDDMSAAATRIYLRLIESSGGTAIAACEKGALINTYPTMEVARELYLTAGISYYLQIYQNSGSPQNTYASTPVSLEIVESLGGTGAAEGGGGASAIDDLSDVTIAAAASGDFLRHNGSVWVDATIQASDIPSAVDAAKLADGSVSNTEFQYLNGVTSALQTQLNAKQASSANLTTFAGIAPSANVQSVLGAADYAAILTLLFGVALPENVAIQLDAVLSADGKYSGIVLPGQTAGAALAFGDLVYLAAADSRWELADADAEATAGPVMLGMCVLAAAGDGSATTILLIGKIRADAKFPALTISAPAYVGTTAGEIQVAKPTGTGDIIRSVGRAQTADVLFFNPSNEYYEHI